MNIRGWTLSRVKDLKKQIPWVVPNLVNGAKIKLELTGRKTPIADITRYERSICSQNGEDGILEAIFAVIGTTNKYFVEFGAGSGRTCNTSYLARRKGWTGLWMDGKGGPPRGPLAVHQEFITAENINALFQKYGVPKSFDLLSIDIDGNDYWVWKAITKHRPRVVIMEYNASVPPSESRAIPYDPNFRWSRTDYFGASLLALKKLGEQKGYTLVTCDSRGVNAFFVEDRLVKERFMPRDIEQIYRSPAYGNGKGHPRDPRTMIAI